MLKVATLSLAVVTWMVVAFGETNCVYGQLDSVILSRVEKNTAGIVHFENFDRLVEFYDDALSERVEQLFEYGAQEPHALYSEQESEHLRNNAETLRSILTTVDQVDLILHAWEIDETPEFTLFVYVEKESAEEMVELSKTIETLAVRFLPANNKERAFDADELELQDNGSKKQVLKQEENSQQDKHLAICTLEIGSRNCLMISNTAKLVNGKELVAEKPKKSRLDSTRRFKTFELFAKKRAKKNGQPLMMAFFEPQNLRPLFDQDKNEKLWNALGVKEMPVAATHVSIDDENVIIADTMITMTVPPSGTAAQWLTYRPLSSIPIVEGGFAKLIANGVDSASAIAQRVKFYDQVYGDGSYQQATKAYYGRSDDEFIEHLGKRTDQRVVVETITEGGRREFLAFDHVANRDSMEQVVTALTASQDRKFADRDLVLKREDDGDSIVWAYPDSDALKKQWHATAHAIHSQWYFQGRQSVVMNQLAKMQKQPLSEMAWHERIPLESKPYSISFEPLAMTQFTPQHWNFHAKLVLADRVIERGGSKTEAKVIEQVKAVRFLNQELDIQSRADRIAGIKYMALQTLIERFGDVVSLFRADERFFENRVVICPGK